MASGKHARVSCMKHDRRTQADEIFSFGIWVSRRRQALRLTQQEIASLVGCSVVLVRKIEADQRRPSAQIAERLARALHIAPLDIPEFIRSARAEQMTTHLPPPDRGLISPIVRTLSALHPRSEGNLPAAVSSFIGRKRELDELRMLLQRGDIRLLTLTGAGGSGKTRLAIEAVRSLKETFHDGIWLVDLAPIVDPTQVLSA